MFKFNSKRRLKCVSLSLSRSFENLSHDRKKIFGFFFFFYVRTYVRTILRIFVSFRPVPILGRIDVCAIPAGTTKIANRFGRMRINDDLSANKSGWWHSVNSCFAESEKAKRKHRSMTQITLLVAARSVFESRLERGKREMR